MYYIHTTYEYHLYHTKRIGGRELISAVGFLHIGPFILYMSRFQPVLHGGIVYRKKPLPRRRVKKTVSHFRAVTLLKLL
jgi:hypothetical protein